MIDAKAFGQELAGMVKAQLSPLITRLDALEKQIANLPEPKDGKDADEDAITARVTEKMASEIEAIRSAVSIPQELPDIAAMVKEAVAAIPAPQDGKSISLDDVRPLIEESIATAVAALPKPKDGEPGRDGLDVKDLFRADGGRLIAVMSDGTTKDLGKFVGNDGEPGKDGSDGFGFDDMEVVYDGEKTITMKFTQGERTKEFSFAMPVVIDRGVYQDGRKYLAGDGVTWAGSFWIAQNDTDAKPDAGDDWRLSVKRGRDGKDNVVKAAPAPKPLRVG